MAQKSKPNAQANFAPGVPPIVAIAQRAATLEGYPRTCRLPVCRRARRCVGPHVRCLIDAMQALPVRVAARHVAAGRRVLREAKTQAECSGAPPQAQPLPMKRLMPTMQALLACIGQSVDR